MALCSSSGIDGAILQLQKLGALYSDKLPEELLNEGADIVVEEWQKSADSHMVSHTGSLVNNIKKSNIKKAKGGGKMIAVYPRGSHPQKGKGKRKRNADVAFILNYSSRYPSQNGWIENAEMKAEPIVGAKWQEIADREISKIGGE